MIIPLPLRAKYDCPTHLHVFPRSVWRCSEIEIELDNNVMMSFVRIRILGDVSGYNENIYARQLLGMHSSGLQLS